MIADWSVFENPEVDKVVAQCARTVHRKYSTVTEVEDLVQDGRIMVATQADLREPINAKDGPHLGILQHRLTYDLIDSVKTESKHMGSRLSYERLVEATE